MRKKMRSQRGIAMIFAIVAFVVVMVLGTVVYTAGYANYSKLFGRNKSRQTYFTLTSTAKLLKKELNGAQIIVEETWTDNNGDGVNDEGGFSREFSYTGSSLAQQILKQLAEEGLGATATVTIEKGDYSQTLDLTVKDIELDHELSATDPAYQPTRETTFTLSCDGREIYIDGNFSPAYLLQQTAGTDEGTTIYTYRSEYTLTVGEIHEKD